MQGCEISNKETGISFAVVILKGAGSLCEVLGFELMALHLPGRHCIAPHSQPFFALGIFLLGFCIYAQAILGNHLPIYASCIAGVAGVPLCLAFID
jgi:hypothetical protein